MSWVENFESILDFNFLTWLKYLSWISQLDLNQVLMSQELDSISMIQLDAISLILMILHYYDVITY